MRLLFAAGLMALAAACTPAAPAGPTAENVAAESKKLTQYLNDEFEEELAMNPMQLTQMGRKEHYGELGDFSEEDARKQLEWRRESVAGMKAQIDPAKLNDDAKTSWAIWESELDRSELRAKWQRYAYIFGYGGPHTDLPNFLITYHKVEEPSDMDAYISRLAALGKAIDQNVERAKFAAGENIRTPKFGYERTAAEAQNIITGAPFNKGDASPLWEDFNTKLGFLLASDRANDAQAAEWKKKAEAALKEQVKPAYERLIAWLKADMANAASGKVGALTLPKGDEWYKASLELLTTTKMTPDEIHELGLSEVKRIHAEMEKIRDAYAKETDPVKGKALAAAVQARALETGQYGWIGQWYGPGAMRANVSGWLKAPVPVMWNVEKK